MNKSAERDHSLFLRARGDWRDGWVSKANEAFRFYLSDQLTKAEKEELEGAGMPSFTINRIHPAVEIMLYFATSGTPRWQAIGREGSDSDMASLFSTMSAYAWDISNGQVLLSQAVRDAIVKGVGYMQVYTDPNADSGLGEVKFRKLNPYNVYIEPKSTHPLFTDAGYILVYHNITKDKAKSIYPEKGGKIAKASSSYRDINDVVFNYSDIGDDAPEDRIIEEHMVQQSYSYEGDQAEIVGHYEVYYKKQEAFYLITMKQTPEPSVVAKIQAQVTADYDLIQKEVSVQIQEKTIQLDTAVKAGEILPERAELEITKFSKEKVEGLKNLKEQMISAAIEDATIISQEVVTQKEYKDVEEDAEDYIISANKFYKDIIYRSITVGDQNLYDESTGLSDYPIVPICYTHTGTPYPQSAVTPNIGKQREINKSHQIVIHNANIGSNLRWLMERGAVTDEEDWDENASRPSGRLEYNPSTSGQPPREIFPLPLNEAFASISRQGKDDIDNSFGVYMQMQGSVTNSQETYRGLMATDEFGTRRVRVFITNGLEPALEQLGRVYAQMSQQVYQIQKIFRIVAPNQLGYMEEKEATINIPIYDDGYKSVIGHYNDIRNLNYDIKFVGGSTMPVNRWALADEYFKYYQAGIIDDIALISELDIKDKESLIKRKSLYSQQQQQIEAQGEQLTALEEQNKSLERQIVQAGIRVKIKDAEVQLDKSTTQREYETKLDREKEAMASKKIIEDLNLNLGGNNGSSE